MALTKEEKIKLLQMAATGQITRDEFLDYHRRGTMEPRFDITLYLTGSPPPGDKADYNITLNLSK